MRQAGAAATSEHEDEDEDARDDFAAAVLAGLARSPRRLPPKFFYDARGSELFDRICDCPEYYLTRAEISILALHAGELAGLLGRRPVIIELGSGSSRKTRLLLDALDAAAYVPIDISRQWLLQAAAGLRRAYPRLPILPLCADFTEPLELGRLGLPADSGLRVAFFPGSTIGNFEKPEALELLGRIARLVGPGGQLLIGFDLLKPRAILEPAYDDTGGITAAFNLNLLHRMRRELGARVDPGGFRHRALYNESEGRVEMHLVSLRAQQVEVRGRCFEFAEGETIHTECSYKYAPSQFAELAARAGFRQREFWTDARGYFGVALCEVR